MQVLLKKQCKAKKEAGEGWKITASSLSSLKKKKKISFRPVYLQKNNFF
jgi:hypothetical protein